MKKNALTLCLSAALLGAPLLAAAEPLSFGEQQMVRSMAGGGVGKALAEVLEPKSVVVVNNRSAICSALSGGISAGFLAANPQAEFRIAAMGSAEDAGAAMKAIADSEVVYLAFGAGASRDHNVELAQGLLSELAQADWTGTLVLHTSTWLQRQLQAVASDDNEVAEYLQKTPMIAVTADLANGDAVLRRVAFDGIEFTTEEIDRRPMRDDLVELFNRM